MQICLSHNSALRFWRSAYSCQLAGSRDPFYEADTPNRKRLAFPKLLPYAPLNDSLIGAGTAQCACYGKLSGLAPELDMVEMSLLTPLGVSYPCHVMTCNQARRSREDRFVSHVCSGDIPDNSVVMLSDDFAVASPEFLFVQMAETLSFVQLVELGFELCGYYAMPVRESESLQDRRQLTCVAALSAFLEKAPRLRGAKAAKAALRYVLDGSASCMETKLAMLLILPASRGGYGLPAPQMNGNVLVRRGSSAETRTCDLLWREGSVVVEYDGEVGHADYAQRTRGARRYDVLTEAGYMYVVVTYGRLCDEADMDDIARRIARRLNHRIRPRTVDYFQKKQALRHALLEI